MTFFLLPMFLHYCSCLGLTNELRSQVVNLKLSACMVGAPSAFGLLVCLYLFLFLFFCLFLLFYLSYSLPLCAVSRWGHPRVRAGSVLSKDVELSQIPSTFFRINQYTFSIGFPYCNFWSAEKYQSGLYFLLLVCALQ